MKAGKSEQPKVVRTERGLAIAGTRVTLYNIMECLKAEWPAQLIQDCFDLNEQQIAEVIEYIKTHRPEVETEYQMVLQQAEESRQYWEERNREQLTQIAALPPKPGKEHLIKKLKAQRMKLEKAA